MQEISSYIEVTKETLYKGLVQCSSLKQAASEHGQQQ
jgi:hypothetical protein